MVTAFDQVVGEEFRPALEPPQPTDATPDANIEPAAPKDKPWRVRSKVRAPRVRHGNEIEPE